MEIWYRSISIYKLSGLGWVSLACVAACCLPVGGISVMCVSQTGDWCGVQSS